jgi:hypothetical protein
MCRRQINVNIRPHDLPRSQISRNKVNNLDGQSSSHQQKSDTQFRAGLNAYIMVDAHFSFSQKQLHTIYSEYLLFFLGAASKKLYEIYSKKKISLYIRKIAGTE